MVPLRPLSPQHTQTSHLENRQQSDDLYVGIVSAFSTRPSIRYLRARLARSVSAGSGWRADTLGDRRKLWRDSSVILMCRESRLKRDSIEQATSAGLTLRETSNSLAAVTAR